MEGLSLQAAPRGGRPVKVSGGGFNDVEDAFERGDGL